MYEEAGLNTTYWRDLFVFRHWKLHRQRLQYLRLAGHRGVSTSAQFAGQTWWRALLKGTWGAYTLSPYKAEPSQSNTPDQNV